MIHLLLLWVLLPLVWENVRSGDRQETGERKMPTGLRGPSREALIYRLASRMSGSVSVSDVVIDIGCSINEAEVLLQSMTDNSRVREEHPS